MHIDGLAKFIDTTTIITLDRENQDINTLLNANDKHVFMRGSNLNFKGSYANYYIANDVVLVRIFIK